MIVHIPQQLLTTLGIAAIAALAVGSYALFERHRSRSRSRPERRP